MMASFRCWDDTTGEGDREGIQGGLPPHRPPRAALPGRVEQASHEVQACLRHGLAARRHERRAALGCRRRARLALPQVSSRGVPFEVNDPSMLIKWSITRPCHRRRRVRSLPWPACHPHGGYLPVTTEPGCERPKVARTYCAASAASAIPAISASAAMIAKPRARKILPAAATTLGVPTTGEIPIMSA